MKENYLEKGAESAQQTALVMNASVLNTLDVHLVYPDAYQIVK